MDSTTLITVSAAIQGIVGFLVWIAVRRPIDDLARENGEMKRDLKTLSNERVKAIEERQTVHEQNLDKLRENTITTKACHEKHEELARAQTAFSGAVIDLAKVEEKVTNTAAFIREVNQRVIGNIADIASVKGLESRIERLEDRT